MAYDERLAARVRKLMVRRTGFEEKKMFGGVGYLLSGNMSCGVLNNDLILRLGEKAKEALAEPGFRPFDITGKAMTGWAMISDDFLDDETLKTWVRAAAKFAGSLPAK